MSNHFVGISDSREQDVVLAHWLYQLLSSQPQESFSDGVPVGEDVSLLRTNYHAEFYPHIPHFALALLRQDSTALTRYAPLLFHLIGCATCHRAYLETYDALSVALADEMRSVAAPSRSARASSLAVTSPKMVVLLCQLLIGLARAVLRQAHRERSDADAWARVLLQQAMQMSRYVTQETLRRRALRDLVEVAGLAASRSAAGAPPGQAALSYELVVGSGSSARGRRKIRRAETLSRANEPVSIDLHAGSLAGAITQQDDLLILHLVDLDPSFHGKTLLISVPLGTLLEPIRWIGGNPYAICSVGPVEADGTLTTPLGRTELQLSNPEERNLLETLFKKLDVRAIER